jgi:hypothetical protein
LRILCLTTFIGILLSIHRSAGQERANKPASLVFTPVNAYYNLRIPTVKPNFYSDNLGFFCKKEIAIEKKLGFPLQFRVGSFDYCNKLEGKSK